MTVASRAALIAVLVVGLAACTSPVPAPPPPTNQVALPAADAKIRKLVPGGDGILAAGSIPGPDGRAPALWTSKDGRGWRAIPLTPATGYGEQAELTELAVTNGLVVALGMAFGGAHGNPRPTLWSAKDANGPLIEYRQPFELLGGPRAVGLTALAASGGAAILTGQWERALPNGASQIGAAVWRSTDGSQWTRIDADPDLAGAEGEQTSARGIAAGPAGFVIAGDSRAKLSATPLTWASTDGQAWHRTPLATEGDTSAARVACDGQGCVTVGMRRTGTHQQAITWAPAEGEPFAPSDDQLLEPQAIAVSGDRLAVVTTAGTDTRIWTGHRNGTGWHEVSLPEPPGKQPAICYCPDLLVATATHLYILG